MSGFAFEQSGRAVFAVCAGDGAAGFGAEFAGFTVATREFDAVGAGFTVAARELDAVGVGFAGVLDVCDAGVELDGRAGAAFALYV